MENLKRFIKIGEDRVNVEEIVCYGFGIDEEDERYLYVETKTSDDIYRFYEENEDFDLDEKIAELDALFLMN